MSEQRCVEYSGTEKNCGKSLGIREDERGNVRRKECGAAGVTSYRWRSGRHRCNGYVQRYFVAAATTYTSKYRGVDDVLVLYTRNLLVFKKSFS